MIDECITTALLHYCITAVLHYYTTALLHDYTTALLHYCITTALLHYCTAASLHCCTTALHTAGYLPLSAQAIADASQAETEELAHAFRKVQHQLQENGGMLQRVSSE